MICLSADNKKWLALAMVFNAVVSRLGVSASHAKKLIAITQYSLLITLLLLLSACGSSSSDEVTPQHDKPKEKPVLKIYLFAPESPIVTRATTGYVDASEAERQVNSIDVWVFEHELPNDLVSYIHLDNLSFDGQKEIAMDLTNEFADLPKKPNVDIYVVANKESCEMADLDKNTTLVQLKEKRIGSSYFGTSPLVSVVPTAGLPMSGLLENQVISGIPPVYTANAQNVKLVRSISKVRFVFSQSTSNAPEISNLSIKIHENMIPKQEYLFLQGVYPTFKSRVYITGQDDYEAETILVSGIGNTETVKTNTPEKYIHACENPAAYVYTSQTGQAYEDMINDGLIDPDDDGPNLSPLSQVGLFYLRESDKKLEGTISYKLGPDGNQQDKNVTFSMGAAGDFTRNHTWIVYGYFLGSGELKLNVVDVKEWTSGSEDPKVYNW